ncbi:MAG TPA: hypothetical protein VMR25_18935 [Planctomycetaceae bacterium]|jgi:hypothetical protein|nr:hypothetical protein [Planctomycetaceae bacterium]
MQAKPDRKSIRRATRLAALMAIGAFLGIPLIGDLLTSWRAPYTNNYLQSTEDDAVGAFIGVGAGLLVHFLLSVFAPQLAALNSRMSADSWSVPKPPANADRDPGRNQAAPQDRKDRDAYRRGYRASDHAPLFSETADYKFAD